MSVYGYKHWITKLPHVSFSLGNSSLSCCLFFSQHRRENENLNNFQSVVWLHRSISDPYRNYSSIHCSRHWSGNVKCPEQPKKEKKIVTCEIKERAKDFPVLKLISLRVRVRYCFVCCWLLQQMKSFTVSVCVECWEIQQAKLGELAQKTRMKH